MLHNSLPFLATHPNPAAPPCEGLSSPAPDPHAARTEDTSPSPPHADVADRMASDGPPSSAPDQPHQVHMEGPLWHPLNDHATAAELSGTTTPQSGAEWAPDMGTRCSSELCSAPSGAQVGLEDGTDCNAAGAIPNLSPNSCWEAGHRDAAAPAGTDICSPAKQHAGLPGNEQAMEALPAGHDSIAELDGAQLDVLRAEGTSGGCGEDGRSGIPANQASMLRQQQDSLAREQAVQSQRDVPAQSDAAHIHSLSCAKRQRLQEYSAGAILAGAEPEESQVGFPCGEAAISWANQKQAAGTQLGMQAGVAPCARQGKRKAAADARPPAKSRRMTRSRAQKLDQHASLPAAPAQKAAAAISASKMLPVLAEGDEEAAREADEGKPNAAASPVAAAAAHKCKVGICGEPN